MKVERKTKITMEFKEVKQALTKYILDHDEDKYHPSKKLNSWEEVLDLVPSGNGDLLVIWGEKVEEETIPEPTPVPQKDALLTPAEITCAATVVAEQLAKS